MGPSALKFVPESVIDEVAEAIGASEDAQQQALHTLQSEQPQVLGFLFAENFELFTEAEREFMLFLVLTTYLALKRVNGAVPEASAEALSDAEESNWNRLQQVSSPRFHERLDVFFGDYPQEDLLAFLEDALSDDEDPYVTREGREAAFVSLKSIIDCWMQAG